MVKQVKTDAEFVQEKAHGVVVVDFFAHWCGPCKAISPFFADLSTKYPNVKFLKVDVDDCDSIATDEEVSAMPTFILYIDGKRVDELIGASQDGLESLIKKHAN